MRPIIRPLPLIESADGSLLFHVTGRPLWVLPSSPSALEVAMAESPTRMPAGALTDTLLIDGAPAIFAIALQATKRPQPATQARTTGRDMAAPCGGAWGSTF